MRNSIKLFMALAVVLCFAGCTHKTLEYGFHSLQINAEVGALTKASGTTWNADQIGVIVIGTDATSSELYGTVYNAHYSTSATTDYAVFSPYDEANTIYFTSASEELTFAAYAPYYETSSYTVQPGTSSDGKITNSTQDQKSDQESIDYLYATGATASESEPMASFTGDNAFKHVMSKLVINIIAGNGQKYANLTADGSTYSLGGLVHSGSFDVSTSGAGKAAADDSGTALTSWDLATYLPTYASYYASDSATEATGITYTAYLYPQTLGTLTFSASVGGETYEGDISLTDSTSGSTIEKFDSGCYYTCNIILSENSASFGGGDGTGSDGNGSTIDDWTDGGSFGGTFTPSN
ncbi:MAG: fimbrillin family protein [Prevotellaceae bacterium]|nr:fimbrillin family protein [Prevotellaceae bacterium]